MARYIELDQDKINRLKREAQQFQDDIVCAVGTDFMENIAKAENKMIFDILKGLEDDAAADVVPKSEEGAECPTCHGTGRIGTTDWLTKNISKEQLAKEKAEAIAEHEQHIKQDYAREIFEGIWELVLAKYFFGDDSIVLCIDEGEYERFKKKYTGVKNSAEMSK